MITLEICAADIHSVLAARESGVDRVELCSSLETGGVTPSEGLIRAAISTGIAVNVLIRPRSGDFVYDEGEVKVMEDDVESAVALGVNGVVIGALKADGSVDKETCRRLIAKAGDVEVTFHRAIDRCSDMLQGVEDIIELKCQRVLTSGGKPSALEGAEMIRKMVERADGRLKVMAGAGVTSANVAEITERTGVREIHASAKRKVKSSMESLAGMAKGDSTWQESDREEIRRLRKICSSEW